MPFPELCCGSLAILLALACPFINPPAATSGLSDEDHSYRGDFVYPNPDDGENPPGGNLRP